MFSSLPLYLDPPNWSNHEQQNHQEASSSISHGGGSNAHHLHTPAPAAAAAAATGQTRPGPMAERARLMKIPQPEAVLRCPRCDSSNTKFCYFNNYSLSQPRHFCKACRRYWTHGGALRNVPVGGGCRRNRRSKTSTSSSKSRPATATSAGNILPVAPPPFLPSSPWQPLQDYYTSSSASGIGFSGLSGSLGTEQWRIQPFPSLWGASEPPSDTAAQEFSGMYPFQGHGVSSGLITQLANVKMEGVISINDPEQLWSATIASGQGGSSLFGGGSAGNGGGGGGGYMNINEVSGGFKSSSTAGLS